MTDWINHYSDRGKQLNAQNHADLHAVDAPRHSKLESHRAGGGHGTCWIWCWSPDSIYHTCSIYPGVDPTFFSSSPRISLLDRIRSSWSLLYTQKNSLFFTQLSVPRAPPIIMSKTFSKDDVASHAKGDSLWIVIDEDVYDVTKFQDEHPGKSCP